MKDIARFYELLFETFGDLNWWPAETVFEVMVGAILTQNTNWNNVEKAIKNLGEAGLLEPEAMFRADLAEIARHIKPSGYFNQKAIKLKRLVGWLESSVGGDLDKLKDRPTESLRKELLSIKGIGAETADDILLYALERPVFVIDAYTYRIAVRHGWVPPETTYDELASLFIDNLPEDVGLFKNYHAAIVEIGKTYCKKRNPLCENCPGKKLLENGRPYEV